MHIEQRDKRSVVVLLAFGIIGIYGFPYMKGTFYNVMKAALDLSDFELSRIWSVFGIVGMLSYLGGGYLTDRISPKKIIIAALGLSALLHIYISFVPNYPMMLVTSGLMGVAAIFAFFSASSKVLSFLGGEGGTGSVFGIYYALEGLGNMLINTIGSRIYLVTCDELLTFTILVRIYAVLNIIAAIGIYICLGKIEDISIQGNKVLISQFGTVLSQKKVWIIAIITMCNYLLYCSLTYITPYLTEIFQVSEQDSIRYAILRMNLLTVFAGIMFGKIADKTKSALGVIEKSVFINCICIIVLLLNTIIFKQKAIAVASTMFYAFVVTGVKVIGIVLITELQFPMVIVGTVIGIVSFIGYSPDAFLYPIAGKILEVSGNKGYSYIFLLCLAMAGIGVLCCKLLKKVKVSESENRGQRVSDTTGI